MYSVVKESEKAKLISSNGVEVWVPKSWIMKDGGLNDEAKGKVYDALVDKMYTLDSNIEHGDCVITKETEKAICVVWLQSLYGGRDVTVWLPKSMKDSYSFVSKKLYEAGGHQPSIRFSTGMEF